MMDKAKAIQSRFRNESLQLKSIDVNKVAANRTLLPSIIDGIKIRNNTIDRESATAMKA